MIRGNYKLTEGGFLVRTQLSEQNKATYPLFLDATAVGRAKDMKEKEARAKRILEILYASGIAYGGRNGLGDSRFSINIGFQQVAYGVYGMGAELRWPKLSDARASAIGTEAMRAMARDLKLYPETEIGGMVYAGIQRAYGMTFGTNPAASSSMDTDGMEYSPQAKKVNLYAHNLYTRQMQLVCIKGIMAVAGVEQV